MKIVVIWFRKSLRIHDSPALRAAYETSRAQNAILLPIFCLDPHFVSNSSIGVLRWIFLLESLHDLNSNFATCKNITKPISSTDSSSCSSLAVFRGDPMTVFTRLFETCRVHSVFFERDTEPYAKLRDAKLKEIGKIHNVQILDYLGHTLYNPSTILEANGGKAPLQYRSFLKLISTIGPVDPCLEDDYDFSLVSSSTVLDEFLAALANEFGEKNSKSFSVPTIEELGLVAPSKPSPFKGGETEAIRRMTAFLADKKKTATFEKPKTSPAAFNPPSTTVLSPYLKFGCLSPRRFYNDLQHVLKTCKVSYSHPPVSLLGQLYWREFYYCVSDSTSNFDKIAGNPVCLDIEWLCKSEPYSSEKDKEGYRKFEAWRDGKTGYPWIDAIMIQLRTEGWIHHLARHSVACFLTRGDLYVTWELGVRVFDTLLLDADWALNNGNWMWLSASAFFHQYFRIYSPISFGQKYDKEGTYIRKYLPVLKDMPAKYIYEPWKAPIAVQRQAGCVIGKDYPKPIIEHDDARKKCLENMKLAYAQGKYGDGSVRGHGSTAGMKDGDEEGSDDESKATASLPKKKQQKTLDSFLKKNSK